MKIIEVEYSELVSEGFNNKKISARGIVENNETAGMALGKIKEWVKNQLGITSTLSHYNKVQIAKEIINEVADKELPF